MRDERRHQVNDILNRALKIEIEKRRAFLIETCAGDVNLLKEVEQLLDSYETQSSEQPPVNTKEIPVDEQPSLISEQTLSHYKILKKIGEGGMGEVYLANDINLNREVAFKVLSPHIIANHSHLKRFEQEAKAASGLNHPNILTIYEFGEADGVHFIATEFIAGETLRKYLTKGDKSRALHLEDVFNITIQIASALTAAHDAGIVHRDIKPENIMLRPDGYVKVLDFGLAKHAAIENVPPPTDTEAQTLFKTAPGIVIGTVAYMSPEQARGLTVDSRTDIWSLGVCLYEMVTGHLPFGGATQTDILVAVLDKHPPKLKNYFDDVPAELERIIDKTLAKNVEERYQLAKDLVLDLKSLKHRLEFEAELERSDPPNKAGIAESNKQLASHNFSEEKPSESPTRAMPVFRSSSIKSSDLSRVQATDSTLKNKNRFLKLVPVLGLISLTLAVGFLFWKFTDSKPTTQHNATSTPTVAITPASVKPPRSLNYSLTVQSYSDGFYKKPFKLAGEMLFRRKDRLRLHVKSPQSGYLYILNQGPNDDNKELSFNILFPSPTTNNGSAFLSPNQEIQIPQQSWFELDSKEGTELVWLVWSENSLPKLESAKQFANPQDKGKIKDSELINFIESFLHDQQHDKVNIEKDEQLKEMKITTTYDIIARVIKLEHH